MTIPVLNLSFSFENKPYFQFKFRYLHPEPYVVEKEKCKVIIFGSPVLGESINKKIIAHNIFNHCSLRKNFISKLNGEFLIVYADINNKNIQIANDRFTSIPLFYYANRNCFKASTKYVDIFEQLKKDKLFEINNNIFFEFLWFRRLYGDKTYDKKSHYLKAARIMSFNKSGLHEEVYWKPNFYKDRNSKIHDFSHELVSKLSQSIIRKTSDMSDIDKAGLFLSGGMDTRVLLGVFSEINNIKPSCFTLGFSEQGEYSTAKKAANIAESDCRFIKLPQDYFSQFLAEKSDLSGGMYNLFSNIFIGHANKIKPYANILFHGHGLDYMFQGMYMPADHIKLFGKNTYFKKTTKLNSIKNISHYYVHNIGHRFNQFDISEFLLPNYRDEMLNQLHCSIDEVMEEGKVVCNDNFDLWEYIMIHTMSRHYSQMDVSGMGTNGDQRKIANDNDLMDLYLRMPLEVRKYARVMREALKIISPKLANLESANTGYRIDASPLQLTNHFAFYKVLRTVTGNQGFRHPGFNERTWPNSGQQIKDLPVLRNLMTDALSSDVLRDSLPYLDWKKVEQHSKKWIENESLGGGTFLMNLMSIHSFLKKI